MLEPEQVSDAADVTAVVWISLRMRSSRSAWGAQGYAFPRKVAADRDEPGWGAPVDEQVKVGGVGPGPVAVVKPGGQPGADGSSERDVAVAEDESSVDDVGEPQLSDLLPARAWNATRATAKATTGSGEFSSPRMTALSSARGRLVATGVVFMPRVGSAKKSLRPLRTLNSDLRPFSA